MYLGTNFTSFTKTNSKWTTRLIVKCKTIRLLKENTGGNLGVLGFVGEF